MAVQVDVSVENHGTVFRFALHTERAREWALEHLEQGAPYQGPYSVVVEHRFARDVAQGMLDDGLEVD